MNLIDASQAGDLDRVRELLYSPHSPTRSDKSDKGRRRIDLNIIDEEGNTPLWLASFIGHLEIVRELLAARGGGADPNIADNDGYTPLLWASRRGHLEIVRELLSAPGGGADPNIANKNDQTPLFWASNNKHLEIVKVLLSAMLAMKNVDFNIVDKNGNTILYIMSYRGYLEIVRELLRAGADPNIVNKSGYTPLDLAFSKKRFGVVEELENFFPSLHILSLRSIQKFKIFISSIPENLF